MVVLVRHLMFGGLALAALLAWPQWAGPGEEGGGRFPVAPLAAAVVFLVTASSPAGERPVANDPVLRTRLAIIAGVVLFLAATLVVTVWLAASAG